MRWLSYLPNRSTLLSLFAAARGRLAKTSNGVAALSDERLASATGEINQIADDIQEADVALAAAAVVVAAARQPSVPDFAVEFEITITLEASSADAADPIFTTRVSARDEVEALSVAMGLVRAEHPELSSQELWAWSFRRTDSGTELLTDGAAAFSKLTVVAK